MSALQNIISFHKFVPTPLIDNFNFSKRRHVDYIGQTHQGH